MQKHCQQAHGWVKDWKKGGYVMKRAQGASAPSMEDRRALPAVCPQAAMV